MILSTGADAITRFYIRYTGTAPTNADLATFDTAVSTAFGARLAALLDTGSLLHDIDSIDLSSSTAAVDHKTVSISGTRGATVLPAEVAAVVSYKIARRYRGGHPRGYWPFGIETDLLTRHQWTSSFTTAMNTGVGNFFADLIAAGWSGAGTLDHVNVSYFTGFHVVTSPTTGRARNVPNLRGTPLVDAITALVTQNTPGAQRRRMHL